MYDYYEDLFNRLNRETNEYRKTCVDRFNPSTRPNYTANTASNYNRPAQGNEETSRVWPWVKG
jgi:hypothetical protein